MTSKRVSVVLASLAVWRLTGCANHDVGTNTGSGGSARPAGTAGSTGTGGSSSAAGGSSSSGTIAADGSGPIASPGTGGSFAATVSPGSGGDWRVLAIGFAGSCTFVTQGGITLCSEYSDCGTSASSLAESCARASLAFSENRCAKTGLVGTCTVAGSANHCGSVLYYPEIAGDRALSIENGQEACVVQDGQWVSSQ